jgi:hypothetical protein
MRSGLTHAIGVALLFLPIPSPAQPTSPGPDPEWVFAALQVSIASLGEISRPGIPEPVVSTVFAAPFLALALLEHGNDKASRLMLVRAIGLNVDAALGEDLNCAVLRKGKSIEPELKELLRNTGPVEAYCRQSSERLRLDHSEVCSTKERIERRTRFLLNGIQSGKSCATR